LPAAGFSWVGVPGQQVIYGMDLCVSKGGVTRTVAQDKAAASPWLNWNWIYWDSAGQTARIMDPTGGGDDLWIHPWWGYRVWANTEDVTIIFRRTDRRPKTGDCRPGIAGNWGRPDLEIGAPFHCVTGLPP